MGSDIDLQRRLEAVFVLLFSVGFYSCDEIYPEVIVKNSLGEAIVIKGISAKGCIYDGTLSYEMSTSPMRCLPGEQRIAFKMMDVEKYCGVQTEYGNIEGLCLCDGGTIKADTGIVSKEPLWYNYMSIRTFDFKRGESYLIELKIDEIEQDFSVPGPYGH